MFPRIFQRVLLIGGVIAVGWLWASAARWMRAPDGGEGALLAYAVADFPGAGLPIVLGMLACGVLIGGLVGTFGNPLAGAFTLAAGMAGAAVAGGSIDPWLRTAGSPEAYRALAVEAALWAVLVGIAMMLSMRLSLAAQRWCFGRTWREPISQGMDGGGRGQGPSLLNSIRSLPPVLQHLAGTGLALAVGSVLTVLLVRSAEIWQVMWGLGLAFVAAGFAAQYFFPRAHVAMLLVSPLLAAALWHLYIGSVSADAVQMLELYFAERFWPAGLALPIHYASAGVAGVAAGVGWARVLLRIAAEGPDAEAGTLAAGG